VHDDDGGTAAHDGRLIDFGSAHLTGGDCALVDRLLPHDMILSIEAEHAQLLLRQILHLTTHVHMLHTSALVFRSGSHPIPKCAFQPKCDVNPNSCA
jgi:hypothetical protein